jgi:hypothetical protein
MNADVIDSYFAKSTRKFDNISSYLGFIGIKPFIHGTSTILNSQKGLCSYLTSFKYMQKATK